MFCLLFVGDLDAQTCDYDVMGSEEFTIKSGEIGCFVGDYSGNVSVEAGGELRVCGIYKHSGAISVNNGGKMTFSGGIERLGGHGDALEALLGEHPAKAQGAPPRGEEAGELLRG